MPAEHSMSRRERIKAAAQRLFATQGLDGVSIIDIVTAAEVHHAMTLYHHFNNKEGLIKELIVDAVRQIDATRTRHLEQLEASGEPLSVRQIVNALIVGTRLDPSPDGANEMVMRFIGAVARFHRHLYHEACGDEYTPSYQKCMELLRMRQADVIPPAILEQRLGFLSTVFVQLMIQREEELALYAEMSVQWDEQSTHRNLLDFLCAGLQAPVTRLEIDDLSAEAR
jgi:AcrR family transcriptional regulator